MKDLEDLFLVIGLSLTVIVLITAVTYHNINEDNKRFELLKLGIYDEVRVQGSNKTIFVLKKGDINEINIHKQ